MGRFRTEPAPDLAPRLRELVEVLEFVHIDASRVHCRRSWGSTAQAYARIWEMPSIWRETLDIPAQYVIEVLSEHFDPLDHDEQTRILIHELLHIPSTFSGALRNHRGQGERIDGHAVNRYFRSYREAMAVESREDGDQLPLPGF
jgi:predicted metallopeptidase